MQKSVGRNKATVCSIVISLCIVIANTILHVGKRERERPGDEESETRKKDEILSSRKKTFPHPVFEPRNPDP